MSEETPPNPVSSATASTSPDNRSLQTQSQTQPQSTTPTTSQHAGNNPNPRSCVTCRRRKVKCNKKHPCSNCIRQNIECIFPAPGRAPRKPRKPTQDAELVERLRKLESVVQSLGPAHQDLQQTSTQSGIQVQAQGQDDSGVEETEDEKLQRVRKELKELMKAKKAKDEKNMQNLTQRFGTLLVKQGRSRYINPGFWATLNAEVEDLKGDIDNAHGQVYELSDSEDEEDYPSPSTSNTSVLHPGYLFGLSSTSVQMTLLHPPAEHVALYWETYKENVDPILKMLHVPTRDTVIKGYATRLDSLPKDSECLLFAICYSAVSSSYPEDCKRKFGEAKTDLLARYRFGMEQALARADFLQTDSIFVLQAFILFITCLRRNTDARLIWSLASLAIRLSQGLGLHRDGDHYPNLPIYKQEMRRRMWWQAVLVDSRSCEDLGSDPIIYDMMSDTKLPRNLNDSDISFDMTTLPESRVGCTDMTFCLIRYEISGVLRKLMFVAPGKCHKAKFHFTQDGIERKKKMLEELKVRIEEKYLKDADLSVPMNWITATTTRLVLSKMWLMLYQPFTRRDGGKSLPQEVRDELFIRSLDNLEYSLEFRTRGREPQYRKYSLLLQTFTQWHALAFLLSELCYRTAGPEVERAWRAVELCMEKQWEDGNEVEKPDSHLWKPLKVMKEKAKQARERAATNVDGYEYATGVKCHEIPQMNELPPMTENPIDLDYMIGLPQPTMNWMQLQTPQQAQVQQPQVIQLDANNPIPLQQLPLPEFNQTDWLGGVSMNGMQDTTMMGGDETTVDWATWDDMVQKWGVQSEVDGGMGPSFFGGGANWY